MYDAIIVGARCAGASTALLLARHGHSVLLLDRDSLPCDMPVSTHMVWHGGVARLARWGLLERLAATNCPPMSTFNLDLGDFVLRGAAPPAGAVEECYAPRRFVLDGLLRDAAIEAGAEVRDGSHVTELRFDNGRVAGVRFTDAAGATHDERARIVIGADGSNSVVAKAVNAPSSNEHPHLQGTFWSYFSDLPIDDMEFFSRPGRMIYAWRTNDGLTLAGICCRYDDFVALRRDPETSFHAELQALAPAFAERARAARRETAWLAGSTRNFCRQASGPGWALVGDAGLTMDPITAAGITNALRDADAMADVVHEGLSGAGPLDDVVASFGARRDEGSLPLYAFTSEMARLDPPTQPIIDLFVGLRDSDDDIADYFGVFAQTVPVPRFFATDNTERIMKRGAAALGRV
jgi:2-polyprenyl-6-methoxyphenol hydroxylase-like FAD-dependent oxidoreductase